jgi:hypothetical protein
MNAWPSIGFGLQPDSAAREPTAKAKIKTMFFGFMRMRQKDSLPISPADLSENRKTAKGNCSIGPAGIFLGTALWVGQYRIQNGPTAIWACLPRRGI